jgi:general secretion pathway protein D
VVTKSAVTAILLALVGAAKADNAPTLQPSSTASASEGHGIGLPALLLEVGGRLHKNFVLDPRAASDKIELLSLRQQDLSYPQLLSILGLYGLAVVPDGTTLQVVPNADVRQAALPIVAPDNVKELDDEFVTCVFPVKNISAAQLVPILRPMIPQWGHLAAFPDRNALILVDRSANVRRLVEIIRMLEGLPRSPVAEPQKSP